MSPRAMCVADRLDAGLVRGPRQARAERERIGVGARRSGDRVRARGLVSRAWTSSSRRPRRRESPSSARPPSQAWPVRRSQATTQSCRPRRSGGRSWSSGRSGRRSRRAPEVVAEEADQPAGERRRVGRSTSDRPSSRARAGGRRRTGPARRPVTRGPRRISGQVRPAGVATGSGALEQGETGQVAERLGDVDRRAQRRRRSRQPPERGAMARRGRATGITRPMIRPPWADRQTERRPRAAQALGSRCERATSGSPSAVGRPGPRNAITDVAGVRVGHRRSSAATVRSSSAQGPVRTGVTVVMPHDATSGPSRSSPAATGSTATAS